MKASFLMAVVFIARISSLLAEETAVKESARNIPMAYQVDVVVVGGSTGAVSAAVAAARKGAKVYLAAPRPYLGEDMCATLRLWLEEGEEPTATLAKELFAPHGRIPRMADFRNKLPFKYEADTPSVRHKDTDPPSLLSDGKWASASRESVQYQGDVQITVDLFEKHELAKAYVMVYHERDFQVENATVYTSTDSNEWKQVAVIRNDEAEQRPGAEAVALSAPVTEKARYVRFFIRRAPGSTRVLVGEIILIKAAEGPPAAIPATISLVRPLHVKRTLDEALLKAGVDFLYSCYATDLLRDNDGNPCGIVMVNRAGRQAVAAKVIIDATDRAWVARMVGAEFRPFPAGLQTLKRVVIGGKERSGKGITARRVTPTLSIRGGAYDVVEYTLQVPMEDGSYVSCAKAEQMVRDMTYHPEQQFASDVFFQVPPDPVKGQNSCEDEWQGVDKLDIQAFRPAGVPRLLILGGCADIPRDSAEKLLRPLALMDMGSRIGAAAADEAKTLPLLKGLKVPGGTGKYVATGYVGESLGGVRPTQEAPTVPQEDRPLPVVGQYDVVVVGGGTSGAPAGIGAARHGARTLVVEYLYGLGGVGTLGSITKYCSGNRVGFTKEVYGGASWGIEQKMEWWRTTLRKAGADIWFGCLGCGAFVEDGRVKGVVVATPQGRGVVLAKVVIDSTGNADIAAAAGATCVYTDASDIAMQGTGLPYRTFGASYVNTDFTIADETDMMDVWHLFVYAKNMYKGAFDLGQLVDTRERRRIVGDFTVTILDQVNKRTYPDTIVESYSGFDTHGYTIDPYFALEHPKSLRTHTPYRCLLPRGLDGILVTGLGISAHRDAMPVMRMQPDLQNQGYAAGAAASIAARKRTGTRQIDIRQLQKHLVEIGNLPKSVLTDEDSCPMPAEKISAAVESVRSGHKGVGILLANTEQALPLLRRAYAAASEQDKLTYAHILGIMGDATGLGTLIAAVEAMREWDQGWKFKAMGQFGPDMSRLDSLILALGRIHDRRATAPILAKVKLLDATKAFSHHRAVALALEMLGDPAAAGPLAELLAKPDMSGHAVLSVDVANQRAGSMSPVYTKARRDSLREIILARALFRCGDKDGIGKKILMEYANDLRGHFARHAHAVLLSATR